MSGFLGQTYLLNSNSAETLYDAVKSLPILDPHNHADVREICLNENYSDIWQVEASTDHYVWEVLRKRGLEERFVTGDADNKAKWLAAAKAWPGLVGNPTYEWVHLDLKRVLGIEDLINEENGERIWNQTQEIFQRDDMRPQQLLRKMGVEAMCSTDDPVDSLEWHKKLADSPIAGMVRPTFRPDKAMNIFKPEWRDYITTLENRFNTRFKGIGDLIAALGDAHDYFAANGCVASDHGVTVPYGYHVEKEDADAVFRKAYDGEELSNDESIVYMSYVLNEVAEMDSRKDWVFQIHMGVVRDVRDSLYNSIGADTGGDISDHTIPIVDPLTPLLNRFDNRLKVVLYCIDPNHQSTLAPLTRAFGSKVNLGSAWWLNDTPFGMKNQLEYIATVDVLANFAGMVSDSRKLLSYGSRHEMFRRCLSDVLGKFVEEKRIPLELGTELAQNMCYHNVKSFWGL